MQFVKKQPVLCIAFFVALISVFFIPPDRQYIEYCNFSVLIQLFCLMITVSGFRSIGVFEYITEFMVQKTGNIRKLTILLMNLCFFFSMFVTNDVALLTFVPLTLMLFVDNTDYKNLIKVIVIETAAANLGSMMTPVGNPQNIFIYAEYNMTVLSFLKTMLPTGIISYIILTLLCFLLPKNEFSIPQKDKC